MTLRCRRCRFAFRVHDGLTSEPESAAPDSVPTTRVQAQPVQPVPTAQSPTEDPAHYATTEIIPSGDAISQSSQVDFSALIGAEPAAPVSNKTQQRKPKPGKASDPEPIGESNPSFSFDNDYDDILDVLEKPAAAPMAPPRAHAPHAPDAPHSPKGSSRPAPPQQVITTPHRSVTTPVQPEAEEVVRQPITRQQLRDHRNARQFWMLMACITACFLGLASWFGLQLFVSSDLSRWEREMLYAMGTPARLLPPQEIEEGEKLLPTNHVKLRGDHIELADRADAFRDDFFEPEAPPEEEFADNDAEQPRNFGDRRRAVENSKEEPQPRDQARNAAPPRRQREPFGQREPFRQPQARNNQDDVARDFGNDDRDAPQVRNVPKGRRFENPAQRPEQAMRVAPPRNNNAQRQKRQNRPFARRPNPAPMGGGGGMAVQAAPGLIEVDPDDGFVNRPNNDGNFAPQPRGNNQPRNPRNAPPRRNAFQPPGVMESDVQVAAGFGIDPKSIQTMALDVGRSMQVALVDNKVFAVGTSNRIAVYDVEENRLLDDQKLDREVAAICSAAKNEITNRPAAWVLYKNGQLEKWEVLDGALIRVVTLSVNPVFKEPLAVVATARNKVAYVHEGKIVISDILEASGKIGFTMRVPVDGQVRALRFSSDESLLVALVDDKVARIPTLEGEIESQESIPNLRERLEGIGTAEVCFSSDLKKLLLCSNRMVSSFRIKDGTENGRYWPSLPVTYNGVVADGEQLLAIAGASRHATLFSMADMEVSADNSEFGQKSMPRKKSKELLPEGRVGLAAAGKIPHEVSRSPIFTAPIQSVQTLPQNRIAFLTQEESNRIAIATWKNEWSLTSLKLDPGIQIKGFSISDDLAKIVIWTDDVIQAWSILNADSGETEFVSECVAHTTKITQVSLTNDGKRIISGDSSGKVIVSNFNFGKRTGGVSGFKTPISNIATRGDEGFVVMDEQGIARGSAGSSRDKIVPFGRNVRGASCLSHGGSKIAWYVDPIAVKVADVNNHNELGSVTPKSRPDFLRFSDDQKYLLLQDSMEISVWDWRQGERVRVFRYSKKANSNHVKLDIADNGKTVAVVTGEQLNQISIFEMPN